MELIAQGAEAKLFRDGDSVVKDRIPKDYRHSKIDDELRQFRTRREAKILEQLPVKGPKLISTDRKERIVMSFVDGVPLRDCLDNNLPLAKEVGLNLRILHDKNIIHGDLTTSNLLSTKDGVAFIDFGLSFISRRVEDKAVDLHLFKEALESTHHATADKAFKLFLEGYGDSEEVLARFGEVESRGRNKEKY